MIKEALKMLSEGQDLPHDIMLAAMNEIMGGAATPAQIGAFLMGLRMKGETVEEVTAAAKVMREKAKKIKAPPDCMDTCGTGGDHSCTFNISTAAAFVVAGADIPVAKHGNRAASSACGSADVLAALGVNIEAGPEKVEECLEKANIGFLFAPLLHAAMKYAIGPRREMGVRTIFNILGPITNPAGARRQLIGVFRKDLTETLARVLNNLGSEAALVVHGHDGLDEITLTGPTFVAELKDGEVRTYQINPEDFGFNPCDKKSLLGAGPEENARILVEVLEGKPGPAREVTALNAGAAIYAGGKADSIAQGVEIALEVIDSGRARERLQQLIELSKA